MQIHLSSSPSPPLLTPLWPHHLPPSLRSLHALHSPFPLLGVQSLPHPLQVSVPVPPRPLGRPALTVCSKLQSARPTPLSSLLYLFF